MKDKVQKQLFAEFQELTTQSWEAKIKADLKGADYDKKLVWRSDEGIHVKPYYRQEDLESLAYLDQVGQLRAAGSAPNSWIVCQDIYTDSDTLEINQRIKAALKGGAQAIRIHLSKCPISDIQILESMLDGVPMEESEIHFEGCLCADALFDMLCEYASSKGVNPALLKGGLGADPLGKMVRLGVPIASMENIGKLVQAAHKTSPGLRSIEVNGALIQNAGSTLVEELAFGLSMASEYMSILCERGIDPVVAQDSLHLSLAAGSNYFMEIAKLRATRILWAKIAAAYGVGASDCKIRIHSTSSQWNMTLYDPYVNMLRGTTEAMSAITGGADMLSVLPFDYPYGESTQFSDRIARNIQIILREEAYFDRVADPASGSYYIESLTDAIAEKVWELFRKVESDGGFMKSFKLGWIQEMVLESRDKKTSKIASGRGRVLGSNAYPNFNESILDMLKKKEETSQLDGDLTPLVPFRVSSLFEELRLQTEESEKRPKVLLFKYGNPAWVTARAAFSGNFFACSGYEIMDQPAFSSVEEGIQVARDSAADLVVLCSSDDAYATLAPAVAEALKDLSIVVIAGNPASDMEALQKAGINYFIHLRSNMLETLKEFNSILL
ncbi:MAG: methylmalonyl-CoA mutase family protein [Bacteroidota bacterium]